MLLRLYRFTDKIGVILLKLVAEAGDTLLYSLSVIIGGARGGILGVLGLLWTVISTLWRWLRRGVSLLWRLVRRLTGKTGEVAARGVQSAASTADTARQRMAERAEREAARDEIDVGLAEDPLRVQNRVLSMVIVLMGFVLVVGIIWATSATQQQPSSSVAAAPGPDVENLSFAPESPSTPTIESVVNTPVPTATPIPAVLAVRGSIAYTAREKGQDDIWVVDVGSGNPLRLTNDPDDQRGPAWSPDGRRLAYAGRQDGNWEIYIYDMVTDETSRVTYDLAFQANPSWSPDGTFIVYESYQGNNLDLYIYRVDNSEVPIRITDNSAPDFAPAWSPDGRRIAYTSLRNNRQDIYVLSLDDPRDEIALNVTNTDERNEDHPAWSPEGDLLAYSALDEGVEKVFVKPVDSPDAPAQVIGRGETPAWSPDGASLVFAVESEDSTHLVASPFSQSGVTTEIIPALSGSDSPTWTSAPLPSVLVNSGGVGPAIPGNLYDEQVVEFDSDPPYRLDTLVDIEAPNAVLNDNVNDSFNALREAVLEEVGYDFLGELEDAFWRIDRPPSPGEERRNWHMTGRAFGINRNLIAGFPAPIEIVREDVGVNTYWRVYVRVADNAQNGQLGEPLRQIPWDFASRNQGDIDAYDQGGRLRAEVPEGYYVNLTQLAADYGWERMPAGRDWRANFNSINFWMFRNADGRSWYESMREIYTEAQLGGFRPTATPPPAPLTGDEPGL